MRQDRPVLTASDEIRRRRARRGRVLGVVLMCLALSSIAAFVVGAVAFDNSWWTEPEPTPGPGQAASDGTSTFSPTGVDFAGKVGIATIALGEDRPPASELSLDDDGSRDVEWIVEIRVVLRGDDESFYVTGQKTATIVTGDGRIERVEIIVAGGYDQLVVALSEVALREGWTEHDITRFEDERIASLQSSGGLTYSAQLQPIDIGGALVWAQISNGSGSPQLIWIAQSTE